MALRGPANENTKWMALRGPANENIDILYLYMSYDSFSGCSILTLSLGLDNPGPR